MCAGLALGTLTNCSHLGPALELYILGCSSTHNNTQLLKPALNVCLYEGSNMCCVMIFNLIK